MIKINTDELNKFSVEVVKNILMITYLEIIKIKGLNYCNEIW